MTKVKKKPVKKKTVQKKTSKAKAGQPTKYNSNFSDQARKYCLLGATDEQLANMFEVSLATISNWKLKHSEFLEALKSGKAIADAEVAVSLFHRAKGYSHKEDKIFNNNGVPLIVSTTKHYPPDPTSAIFWLKNRQKGGWRDKHDHEHSGNITIVASDIDEAI